MRKLLVFATLFFVGSGLNLPSDFTTCKRSGGNVGKCLEGAIQNALRKLEHGLEDFNFPPLNPLNVPSMTIGQGTGPVQVVQNFKNINIYGIHQMKIEKVKANVGTTSLGIIMDGFIPNLKLVADYTLDGRILVLPVIGTGKCTITLKDVKVHSNLLLETFVRKGKTYSEVKKLELSFQPQKVEFNFENLFNGDERLGAEVNKVLNENWKVVFDDVRSGYEESLAIIVQKLSNLIFMRAPYDVVFPL